MTLLTMHITIGFSWKWSKYYKAVGCKFYGWQDYIWVWSFAGGAFSPIFAYCLDGWGRVLVSGTQPAVLASITDETRVGGSSAATTDWNGSIRQVRLYSRGWTQEEAFAFWNPSTRDSIFLKESRAFFFLPQAVEAQFLRKASSRRSRCLPRPGSATGAATAMMPIPHRITSSPTGEAARSRPQEALPHCR